MSAGHSGTAASRRASGSTRSGSGAGAQASASTAPGRPATSVYSSRVTGPTVHRAASARASRSASGASRRWTRAAHASPATYAA
jgi:hypothetical protein